jgi:AcrR family transcriptional regulator
MFWKMEFLHMTRTTKSTWLDEALKILAEQGASFLTIETLTQRLNLTKGSFYHHFKSYEGFKTALLTYFEEVSTLHIIRLTNEEDTPQKRLIRLLQLSTDYPPHTEVGFRAWAMQDAEVRAYQQRIDIQRHAYVRELFLEMGYADSQSALMSHVFYAILIGGEHMLPTPSMSDFKAMFDEFLRLYDISTGD